MSKNVLVVVNAAEKQVLIDGYPLQGIAECQVFISAKIVAKNGKVIKLSESNPSEVTGAIEFRCTEVDIDRLFDIVEMSVDNSSKMENP